MARRTSPDKPQPILEFRDREHLMKCVEWWKKKLFLTDWIIHVYRTPLGTKPLDDDNMGRCKGDLINRAAVIHIATYDSMDPDCSMTLCEEKILVHELLHCKFPSYCSNTYEGFYMDQTQHSEMERLAKSLMMVKYDLPFEWFDNDWWCVHAKD